jgi:predicted  nucleic acid-binding Zn-ribbon protein
VLILIKVSLEFFLGGFFVVYFRRAQWNLYQFFAFCTQIWHKRDNLLSTLSLFKERKMKARKTILIPITLGLMISACSTSSRQQTDAVIESEVSQTESPLQSPVINAKEQNPVINTKEIELEKELESKNTLIGSLQQQLESKNALIDTLQRQLVENKKQLFALNQSLDEKDATIAALQKSTNNAETLAALEEQKKLRQALESRYAALKLDNDLLVRRIGQLENENTSLKQQVSSLENMLSSQDGFQQSYLTLLGENTELQKKYADLEADNQANQQRLSTLKKENLMLGGALSDARAQHQVLWDKIRALSAVEASKSLEPTEPIEELPTPIADNNRSDYERENAQMRIELAALQAKVSEQKQLNNRSDYERENTQMRIELADLQAKIAEQKQLIEEYRGDVLKLEAALDEGADYAARWKELDLKLAQAQQSNVAMSAQLNAAEAELAASQTELSALSARLMSTQQALEAKENSSISVGAAIDSLQSQVSATLQNVQWQLPNEIALYNTFEILVSANVQPSLSGQTYQAELVTDSDIQMVSDPVASAVVQDGRLQWRWRVSGLNEKPNAQLNLFVSQQINFQDQTIQRQVYRGNENLSLINTNLLEKYGYWGVAILLGLLGGFLIGRLNKRKTANQINS